MGAGGLGWKTQGCAASVLPPPVVPTPGCVSCNVLRCEACRGGGLGSPRQDPHQKFTPTSILQVDTISSPRSDQLTGTPQRPKPPTKRVYTSVGDRLTVLIQQDVIRLDVSVTENKEAKMRFPEPTDKHMRNMTLGDKCLTTPGVPGSPPCPLRA